MKYLNINIFRNKDELGKSVEREHFDRIYKNEENYSKKMEMLEVSLDIEPNLGRDERYCFVNGLTIAKLIIDRLSCNDNISITNEKLLMSVTAELECAEKTMGLDDYQKEYFRYGIFSGMLLNSNEKAREKQKKFKKAK